MKHIPDKAIKKMLGFAKELLKTIDTSGGIQQIEVVEQYLAGFREEVIEEKRIDVDENAIHGIAVSLGFYIGELCRLSFENETHRKLFWVSGVPSTGGDSTMYLTSETVELYPIDWIYKFLYNDESILDKAKYLLKKKLT